MSTVEDDIKRADTTYAKHEIKSRGEGRWLLQNPEWTDMWTEILHCEAGTIIVHGDGPDIAFRSYVWNAEGHYLVRWAGRGGTDYIGSKVCMGEAESWDRDLALEELREYVGECIDDGETPGQGLVSLLMEDFPEHPHDLARAMYEANAYDHDGWIPGTRPSWTLIAAQAACRRLTALLDAERKSGWEAGTVTEPLPLTLARCVVAGALFPVLVFWVVWEAAFDCAYNWLNRFFTGTSKDAIN